jgi:hypothetical protein
MLAKYYEDLVDQGYSQREFMENDRSNKHQYGDKKKQTCLDWTYTL